MLSRVYLNMFSPGIITPPTFSASYVPFHTTSPYHFPHSVTVPVSEVPLATAPSFLIKYASYLKTVYNKTRVADPYTITFIPSDVYIRLALVKKQLVNQAEADNFTLLTFQGDVDRIVAVKEEIEMEDILKEKETRLVVVEGAPGIGKSTLALELCRRWPTMDSLRRFSLVVLLRLREESVQLATEISDLFYHLSKQVGKEVERTEGEGVLFIFDGFDEFPAELREKSLVMDIIKDPKYLPRATVLVTSRPSASADFQPLLQASSSKHIEVVGFNESYIHKYAEAAFSNANDAHLLSNFSTYLSLNPVVKGMMYNPLNSAIVVMVYRDTFKAGKPVPQTQTQLYTELTLCRLSRYFSKKGDPMAKKLPDKLSDLPHNSSLYKQLIKIGELAFEGTRKGMVIFKHIPEGCTHLGLLVEHTDLYSRKEKTTFNFFHLTLQEYMSAFYISQLPDSEQKAVIYTEWCSDSVHANVLDVVLWFVAGLTKMQSIGWSNFNSSLFTLKNDVVLVKGSLLIRCFYEAQDSQSCATVFGQHEASFSHAGVERLSNYDIFSLGYCVSACKNSWNVEILSATEFDQEIFNQGMKSVRNDIGARDQSLVRLTLAAI